jgi:hypothetical protein
MALKPKKCWYCEHFLATLPGTNQGECRRHAPSGLDSQMINDFNGDETKIFARIYNGTTEWCGEFQPAVGEVPDPS